VPRPHFTSQRRPAAGRTTTLRIVLRSTALALTLVAAAPVAALAPGLPSPREAGLERGLDPVLATSATMEPSQATTATLEPSHAITSPTLELPPAIAAPTLEPSQATTAPGPTGRPPLRVETSQQPGETGWLDVGHAAIERKIFLPVLWVDRFFADERDTDPARSRSFVRVRQEVSFAQFRGGPGYGISFNASLRFPSLDQRLERLRLEMVGEARDAFTAILQGDRTAQGELLPPEQQYGTADAGLGYRLWETLNTHGDLGAGIMLQLPPGAYVRARLRFVEPLGKAFLARQAVTAFWRTDTLFGSTGSAELERPLPFAPWALWRLSGTTTITQRSRGFEWAGDLSLIATLFLKIGGQLGFGVSGATKAPADVDVYHAYLRLRRDVYRKWIFFEVSPEYQWPWMPTAGHRIGFWDVALRFEIQFQGSQAPHEPPHAVSPHEPADPPPQRSLPPPPRSG
jgi:hypothetical protein